MKKQLIKSILIIIICLISLLITNYFKTKWILKVKGADYFYVK